MLAILNIKWFKMNIKKMLKIFKIISKKAFSQYGTKASEFYFKKKKEKFKNHM